MRRRAFLVAAGSAAVAGCAGTDDGAEGRRASIGEVTLVEGAPGRGSWARVAVHNDSDVDHGWLELRLRFLDVDDEVIATRRPAVELLPATTTWRHYACLEPDAAGEPVSVDRATASVFQSSRTPSITRPETAEVVASELTVDAGVTVTGTVDAGDTPPVGVSVIVLVYDDEGRLRGTLSTLLTDFAAGDRRTFEATDPTIRTPSGGRPVSNHDVLLDEHRATTAPM